MALIQFHFIASKKKFIVGALTGSLLISCQNLAAAADNALDFAQVCFEPLFLDGIIQAGFLKQMAAAN